MTMAEQEIINRAVVNGLAGGVGLVTAAKEAIKDAGGEWTLQHEFCVFIEASIEIDKMRRAVLYKEPL